MTFTGVEGNMRPVMSSNGRMLCRVLLLGAALLACPAGLPEEVRGVAEEGFLVHREEKRVEARRLVRRPDPPPIRVVSIPPVPSPVHPAFVRDVSRLVRPPTL